jgi:hypothetical protein
MSFLSFMGHRILAIILLIVAVWLFIAPEFIFNNLKYQYWFLVIGLLFLIASIYFFKSKH